MKEAKKFLKFIESIPPQVKEGLIFFLLILLTFPLILPYFHPGFFPTHDGEWAVVRLADMFRLLRDHEFPARFSGSLNFGYGYPLFNFAYPFPYYLAVLFHFLKFTFVDSVKLMFALTVPISAIGMFLLSRKLWGSMIGGIASAILYCYLPYRVVDLYVRGSIGESVAFACVPFIFYSIFNIDKSKNKRVWVFIGAVSYAILIMSHNIMAVLFSVPLIVFAIYLGFINRKIVNSLCLSLGTGLILSAFFTIPALFEKGSILLSRIPIADRSLYFVSPAQLLFSPWGYGVPTDVRNAFTYQIGLPQLIVFLLAACFACYAYFKDKKISQSVYFAISFLITAFLMSLLLFSPTLPIWQYTPLLKEINYPWTLLGPIGFIMSLLAGFVLSKKYGIYIVLFLSALSIILILPNARPQYYVRRGDDFYITNEATTTSSDELMPLWVKQKPTSHFENKVAIINGEGKISDVYYKSNKISFNYDSDSPSIIQISTIYYPGWRAFSNKSEKAIFYDNDKGLMQLKLLPGNQKIEILYGETPLHLFADLISIIGFLLIVLYVADLKILKKIKLEII